ncbi:MAG: amidohydrolase family protein [Acidobacteria bacterium]|nr:amidohydrolase family protein [Acidobacteriota bacterium]
MRRVLFFCLLLFAFFLLPSSFLVAQSRPLVSPSATPIYQRLLPQVARIKIFDHHAHPGWADDTEVDPAPVPPSVLPLRLREENPDWVAAARALFAFPFSDLKGTHGRWLADKKAALRKSRPGPQYFDALLDQLGVETSVANRITMADYLDPRRFKWVFYIDPVLFPFDTSGLAARNPDQAAFMPNQTKLLRRLEQQVGAGGHPPGLAAYLSFVTRVLEDHQRRGAIAAKFEIAYFRSFVFDDPPPETAAAVYDKYRSGGVPAAAEYKTFQDFVFRHVVAECGRLHLPVHIHSSAGAGDYFSLAGVNVLNLEPVLRDLRYSSTTFVLIHGGYPFEQPAILMALMKNVWLDSSATGSFLLYPQEFKDVLRRWFAIAPEKVTYGSDAFPIDERIGAEELYWFGVHNARTATAAALAEMIAAREITESQAMAIARGYLHDNAAGLYR